MTSHPTDHQPTNFGIDVATETEAHAESHHVIPAHVDEHAREELAEGIHPDHATNFALILPVEDPDS
jgi:hypothetical protein